LLEVIAKSDLEGCGLIDHWGAAKSGLQLGGKTRLYPACPPRRAAQIGALIVFICPYVQPFACLSRRRPCF